MREYGESANIAKSRGLSIQGVMFGCVLAIVSMLTIRLGPIEASLTLIPLTAIFIWPRGSSRGMSSVFVFAIGLLVDVVRAGPPGLWAFIYLAFYGLFQPDLRSGVPTLKVLWPQFTLWLSGVVFIVIVIGKLFVQGRTSISALLMQAAIAALLFPVFFGIRQGLRQFVSDPDDPGYVR